MLTTILTIIVVAIALVLIVAARQPDEFRVSRSTVLPAAASVVFPHVNELRKWETWSPWARLDPDAKSTFEGPAAGTGAVMRWAGNKNVGEGSMTITDSRANELVRFRLEFLKPFKATNTAEFEFRPQGDQTHVTWSMYGENNFMSKVISLFINCEKMVGGQFEQGFANLKEVVEKAKG
jgi:hypothetical protein